MFCWLFALVICVLGNPPVKGVGVNLKLIIGYLVSGLLVGVASPCGGFVSSSGGFIGIFIIATIIIIWNVMIKYPGEKIPGNVRAIFGLRFFVFGYSLRRCSVFWFLIDFTRPPLFGFMFCFRFSAECVVVVFGKEKRPFFKRV